MSTHKRRHKLSSVSCASLPLSSLSTRLVSYWGVAQGFRSLLAVISCELLASSAYIFMGALGAAASSWLAIRSAGLETEKQIRQCIGEEVGKILRERAPEASESVADVTMQPCKEAVDRFASSLSLRAGSVTASPDVYISWTCYTHAHSHRHTRTHPTHTLYI